MPHGDEGPDLHNLAISNARISSTIKNGIKGEMPTFGKRYNDQQIATLVAYPPVPEIALIDRAPACSPGTVIVKSPPMAFFARTSVPADRTSPR